MALYQAKSDGRGTTCYFNETIRAAAESKLKMEQDLANAIQLGQLRLLYQPQINATDQGLMGFEALIRCTTRPAASSRRPSSSRSPRKPA